MEHDVNLEDIHNTTLSRNITTVEVDLPTAAIKSSNVTTPLNKDAPHRILPDTLGSANKGEHLSIRGERSRQNRQRYDNLLEKYNELHKKYTEASKHKSEKQRLVDKVSVLENSEKTLQSLLEERENELLETKTKLHLIEQHTDGAQQVFETMETLKVKNQDLEKIVKENDKKTEEMKTKHLALRKQLKDKIDDLTKNEAQLNQRLKSQADIIKLLRKKNETASTATNLPNDIEAKLDIISNNIMSKVTALVDQKLQQNLNMCNKTSYAEKTLNDLPFTPPPQVPDFQIILKEAKNNELVDLKEQKRRETNIIIHGVSEDLSDEGTPIQEQDNAFVKDLLTVLEAPSVIPKQIIRLGKPKQGTKRPLKIIMNSRSDKNKIMSNLRNLKTANPKFKVSIRDDHTIEQRELIKKYVEEANRKNADENTADWKVRGNAKNGWRVVKITTQ